MVQTRGEPMGRVRSAMRSPQWLSRWVDFLTRSELSPEELQTIAARRAQLEEAHALGRTCRVPTLEQMERLGSVLSDPLMRERWWEEGWRQRDGELFRESLDPLGSGRLEISRMESNQRKHLLMLIVSEVQRGLPWDADRHRRLLGFEEQQATVRYAVREAFALGEQVRLPGFARMQSICGSELVHRSFLQGWQIEQNRTQAMLSGAQRAASLRTSWELENEVEQWKLLHDQQSELRERLGSLLGTTEAGLRTEYGSLVRLEKDHEAQRFMKRLELGVGPDELIASEVPQAFEKVLFERLADLSTRATEMREKDGPGATYGYQDMFQADAEHYVLSRYAWLAKAAQQLYPARALEVAGLREPVKELQAFVYQIQGRGYRAELDGPEWKGVYSALEALASYPSAEMRGVPIEEVQSAVAAVRSEIYTQRNALRRDRELLPIAQVLVQMAARMQERLEEGLQQSQNGALEIGATASKEQLELRHRLAQELLQQHATALAPEALGQVAAELVHQRAECWVERESGRVREESDLEWHEDLERDAIVWARVVEGLRQRPETELGLRARALEIAREREDWILSCIENGRREAEQDAREWRLERERRERDAECDLDD